MKAAVYTRYGPPEVVMVKEVAAPVPAEDEVLVKVIASTVNRTDTGFRSAVYIVSRLWSGLFKPRYPILGCEFAGDITVVGNKVQGFSIGDRVFGYNDQQFGGHAEYLTIKSNAAIATIPEGVSYEKAAASTEGAHYAWGNIRAAKVKAGDNVMVYGATGAIGSAAVQLMKYIGARVTAVANTRNVGLLQSLGADEVVDYQNEQFTQTSQRFSFIFDAVGKSSFGECKPLLTERGIYVSTEPGKNGENIWYALTTPLYGRKKVIFPIPSMKKEDLLFLRKLVEEKKFSPVIDRNYSLDNIVEAHRYVDAGQKTGNVIINIIKQAMPG